MPGNSLSNAEILAADVALVAALHPVHAVAAGAAPPLPSPSAAATPSEHVGSAVDDDVLVGPPEFAGADREPSDLAVGCNSPDLIDDGLDGAVLPFVAPPPAVEPEPVESTRERLARRTAETEARMGQLRAEGRARNGGVLPRAWALVAGTGLASSVEAPAPADAVYARAGPNRCAPSSPWDRFDLAA